MALGDTAPTAYPASGRAYPMVPCVPSELTHATGRIQPASKEESAKQQVVNSEYSEYRGLYVVSANKGQWQRLVHLPPE